MSSRTMFFSVLATLCFANAALAQQTSTTPLRAEVYSVARENTVEGKVVEYNAPSAKITSGARMKLETASGVMDVHLGNGRLLAANNVTLNVGDVVSVIGEEMTFGNQTIFAARVIQKDGTSVTLRSEHGVPLVVTPRAANTPQATNTTESTAAGAR